MSEVREATWKPECQRLFGVERGGELIAKIEEATGQPCPCKQGQLCPLRVLPRPRQPQESDQPRIPRPRRPQDSVEERLEL